MSTIWTKATKNASSFTQRVKNFLVYFWGNQDEDYIVDHLGRKIVFSLDYSFTGRTKNAAVYTKRTKN
jgi:hypothetical protein